MRSVLAFIALLFAVPTTAAPAPGPLAPADVQQAARVLGFSVRGSKIYDECDAEVQGVEPTDLNGDGRAELIFRAGFCRGGDAGWFGIVTRTPHGGWRAVAQEQGGHELLASHHGGWPDIHLYLISSPQPLTLRWSGSAYAIAP